MKRAFATRPKTSAFLLRAALGLSGEEKSNHKLGVFGELFLRVFFVVVEFVFKHFFFFSRNMG